MKAFLILILIAVGSPLQKPFVFQKMIEKQSLFEDQTPPQRKALIIANPYTTRAMGMHTPTTNVPFSNYMSGARSIGASGPNPSTAPNFSNSPNEVSPFSTPTSLYNPINISDIQNNAGIKPEEVSYLHNSKSYTKIPMNAYQNLQTRAAANTLEQPTKVGIGMIDLALQQTNNLIGGFGNMSNLVTQKTVDTMAKASEHKDYLTQEYTALQTGAFASGTDTTKKIIEINKNVADESAKIRNSAKKIPNTIPNIAFNQPTSYFQSTYGTGFKNVV